MTKIAVERSKKTSAWIQATRTGVGTCFLISWNNLELFLKSGKLPSHATLRENEFVERYEVTDQGVTIFIGTQHASDYV